MVDRMLSPRPGGDDVGASVIAALGGKFCRPEHVAGIAAEGSMHC
jgi:hypothetical protein